MTFLEQILFTNKNLVPIYLYNIQIHLVTQNNFKFDDILIFKFYKFFTT